MIVLEAGGILDGEILPEFDCWDIRRYGDTQIAIRVLPEVAGRPGRADDAERARTGGGAGRRRGRDV